MGNTPLAGYCDPVMGMRRVLSLGLLALSSACSTAAFVCDSDVQCGAEGRCEANGNCSFLDPECESGRRFGALGTAGAVCVPPSGGASSSGGTDDTTTDTQTPDPPSTQSTDASTSTGEPGTTIAVVTESASGTSTGSDTANSSSDSSTGEPPLLPTFFDDFERPDSDEVGNGWVEKTPEAMALVDGALRRVAVMTNYPDNLVYRPDASWLDVEAMLEFTFDQAGTPGTPQFSLRTQPEDIDDPGSITSYLVFISNDDLLRITRQDAGTFAEVFDAPLSRPLQVGARYRLRLRVAGTDPVELDAVLEQEQAGGWQSHSEVHDVDDTAERLVTPGTVALGGHTETEFWSYDAVTVFEL